MARAKQHGTLKAPTIRRCWEPEELRAERLDLLDDGRLQFHLAEAVHLGGDIMVARALDQADIAHLGSGLQRTLRALDLHGFGDADGISVLQRIADSFLDLCFDSFGYFGLSVPFMCALWADQQGIHFVGVLAGAFRARWQGIRHEADFSDRICPMSNESDIE